MISVSSAERVADAMGCIYSSMCLKAYNSILDVHEGALRCRLLVAFVSAFILVCISMKKERWCVIYSGSPLDHSAGARELEKLEKSISAQQLPLMEPLRRYPPMMSYVAGVTCWRLCTMYVCLLL